MSRRTTKASSLNALDQWQIDITPIINHKRTRPLMKAPQLLQQRTRPSSMDTSKPVEKQFQEIVWLTKQATQGGIRKTFDDNRDSMSTLDASMINAILNATRIPTPNYVTRTSFTGTNKTPPVRKSRQLHVNMVPFAGVNKQEPQNIKSISLETFVDMMPYTKYHCSYYIDGPLKLIFDHFKTREDPKLQYSSLTELSFDDIQRANETLSQKELLYFAAYFGIISEKVCSNAELLSIAAPVKDTINTQRDANFDRMSDLELTDFVEIMARVAYYVFPRLPGNKQKHQTEINKVSMQDKIDAFMKYFKFDDLEYVRKMNMKAPKLDDIHMNSNFCHLRSINKQPVKDLMRMGLAIKVGKHIGRDTHWNVIKRDDFIDETALKAMRKYVSYKPEKDHRKFDSQYINFGCFLVSDQSQSKPPKNTLTAQIVITNNSPKSGYHFVGSLNPYMTSSISSMFSEKEEQEQALVSQFVKVTTDKQHRPVVYAEKAHVNVTIDYSFIQQKKLYQEFLFFIYVFGQDVYHQETEKLLYKVPVYVRFEPLTDVNQVQKLPSIKIFNK